MASLQQKTQLRKIFGLKAQDGKIDQEGIEWIFDLVGFFPPPEQHEELMAMLFSKKNLIGFEEFSRIFSMKCNNHFTANDIENAFKLLSTREKPGYIKLKKVKKILMENDFTETEIIFLMDRLKKLTDKDGLLDYNDLIKTVF
eukprot:CAMPEP_0115005412 /NCGR_PEP_ID=MMETSP0216-20121206/19847_1 /TAXON_ID=223996 /ORGANISM="Protocruzia adherens, Strain Boccale" /LENGTH=142 /DNA_ID=CAMNT_0002371715 /DNA_START=128 /DNA_END=556 /DNA_ORIENTATION=-